ncbi:MAG: hypothetical protein PF541_07800 [Prolixibacteraceae bacterium]|nr:hypothetical protein [Prolixibacteraceae bacterium]
MINTHRQFIQLYEGVWAVCPNGDKDKDKDGNLTRADGCFHGTIGHTLIIINGNGTNNDIFIPISQNPPDPFTPPTGGTTTTNPTGTSGTSSSETETDDPTKIDDEPEPDLPPLPCRCNVCNDCGRCILEPEDELPTSCVDVCDCFSIKYNPCNGKAFQFTNNTVSHMPLDGVFLQTTTYRVDYTWKIYSDFYGGWNLKITANGYSGLGSLYDPIWSGNVSLYVDDNLISTQTLGLNGTYLIPDYKNVYKVIGETIFYNLPDGDLSITSEATFKIEYQKDRFVSPSSKNSIDLKIDCNE